MTTPASAQVLDVFSPESATRALVFQARRGGPTNRALVRHLPQQML